MVSSLMKSYLRGAKRWPKTFGAVSLVVKQPILWCLDGVSYVRGFYLPRDSYLPPYKIQMILGLYESETVRLCKELIKPGMTVVDGGAHVGYFTRVFAKAVGSTGKVIAYEPHPQNFKFLERNVQSAKLKNVVCRNAAIGSKADSLTLFTTEGSVGHSLHQTDIRSGGTKVEVVALDDDLATLGITSVDFVKLDVEGNEIEALKGASTLLAKSPSAHLILEYRRDNANITSLDLLRISRANGHDLFVIQGDGPHVKVNAATDIERYTKCNLLAMRTGDVGPS